MPQSTTTLDYSRSRLAYESSRSHLVSAGRKGGNPYVNAAKRLWRLSDDWEVNLLMNVFGPDRLGAYASALDIDKGFHHGHQLIDVARRRRERDRRFFEHGFSASTRSVTFHNYELVPVPHIVGEFIFEDVTEEESFGLDGTWSTTFFEDSTNRLRQSGMAYSEMEACKTSNDDWVSPSTDPYVHKYTTYQPLLVPFGAYERTEVTVTWTYPKNSTIIAPANNWGTDLGVSSLADTVKQFATDRLPDVLPQCLTNRRTFNAFYQIGELKDLPMMIEKTISMYNYLRSLAKGKLSNLLHFDKQLGDAYLNKEFGYDSVEQAITSLMKQPEKIAKRFNYLLKRNSKITSQRFTLDYNDPSLMESLNPSWTMALPVNLEFVEDLDSERKFTPKATIRCVVNSTINIPPLAVPKFSDSTFRNMLGLDPWITDLYNLIPWTWLVGWFTDVGKYLNMFEALARDNDLINYGFITVIYDAEIAWSGKVRITGYDTIYDVNQNIVSQTENGTAIVIPYSFQSKVEYRKRFPIDDLFGVKSVDDKQNLLTDFQKSILGSLLTKFT